MQIPQTFILFQFASLRTTYMTAVNNPTRVEVTRASREASSLGWQGRGQGGGGGPGGAGGIQYVRVESTDNAGAGRQRCRHRGRGTREQRAERVSQGHREDMTWMCESAARVAAAGIMLLLCPEREGDAVLTQSQAGTGSRVALRALGHH